MFTINLQQPANASWPVFLACNVRCAFKRRTRSAPNASFNYFMQLPAIANTALSHSACSTGAFSLWAPHGRPAFLLSVFTGINTRGEKPAAGWRVQRCCRAQLAQFGMTMRIGVGDALTHQPGVHLVVGSEPQPRREESRPHGQDSHSNSCPLSNGSVVCHTAIYDGALTLARSCT
jgi:hypothetical protein